jgi:hypothetical protein
MHRAHLPNECDTLFYGLLHSITAVCFFNIKDINVGKQTVNENKRQPCGRIMQYGPTEDVSVSQDSVIALIVDCSATALIQSLYFACPFVCEVCINMKTFSNRC